MDKPENALPQLDKKKLKKLIFTENKRILDLLTRCNVPESTDDLDIDSYLLNSSQKLPTDENTASIDELQDRLTTIKNKIRTKKNPTTERAQKKREAKKLKKNKEFKKVLSVAKSFKNEQGKLGKAGESEDCKKRIKSIVPKPIFNEEGKIVFSKFDFAAHPGAKTKKSHQNPREILKKIKETDKKINELKEQGNAEKASELKNEIAWKKAFDRVDGKKVKDDPKLLHKSIKKRKDEKKKTKTKWADRKKRVEMEIGKRQKKRQENIDKRRKDKRTKKLKKLSKKGRVIPGF